jgi:hypothetical protein
MPFKYILIRSSRGADCDTDHYLVDAKIRQRLSVNKQAVQTFDMERFNLRDLSDVEVKVQFQVKISNRFAALENLHDDDDDDDDVGIN